MNEQKMKSKKNMSSQIIGIASIIILVQTIWTFLSFIVDSIYNFINNLINIINIYFSPNHVLILLCVVCVDLIGSGNSLHDSTTT